MILNFNFINYVYFGFYGVNISKHMFKIKNYGDLKMERNSTDNILTDNSPEYRKKFLESNAGNTGDYSVNIKTGAIKFVKNIVSLGGELMPLNLTLVYNPFYGGSQFVKDYPNGWKLNVQQYIYASEGNFVYVDNNYKEHTFKKINDSLYYDVSHSGLLMKISGTDKIITDDRNFSLYFNSSGYLIKAEEKNGTAAVTTLLSYTNGKLSKITDGMGRQL